MNHRIKVSDIAGSESLHYIDLAASYGKDDDKSLKVEIKVLETGIVDPEFVVFDQKIEVYRTGNVFFAVEKYNSL